MDDGIKAAEIEKACKKVFIDPLIREPNEFGMSQSGFCLDRIRLQKVHVDEIVETTNGNFVVGKYYHRQLKKIIKNTSYGKAHLPKNWWDIKGWIMAFINRPRFEKIVRAEHSSGFKIKGHCDCDLPALSKIIEFKTTGSSKSWDSSNEVLMAYILQANAYAWELGRESWELWIMFKNFTDVHKPFMTVISGIASEEIYIRFIERLSWVWYAIQNGGELAGPEMDWECNGCNVKRFCEKIKKKYQFATEILPCSRSKFVESVGESTFKLFYRKKWIIYEPNQKIYHISPDFKVEYGL